MTPKGHLYRKEYARELLIIAEGDISSARALLKAREGRPENICFMSQQAVEKALKALICHFGHPIVHSHDLGALIKLIPSFESIPHWENIDSLTQYALVRRYEQGFEILESADLLLTVKVSEEILEYASKIVKGSSS